VQPKVMRRRFLVALRGELQVIWPILSGLLVWKLALGLVIGFLERWRPGDAVYFTFVTGLTIGYGDLVPQRGLSRILAVLIGILGILLTGLVVAIGVRALQAAANSDGLPAVER
jgi:Ion channel